MTNQSTIDKLIEMRLIAMADAFHSQMDDPKLREVFFDDRFGILVDIEFSSRKNNRLIKADPECCIQPAQCQHYGYQLHIRAQAEQGAHQTFCHLRIYC